MADSIEDRIRARAHAIWEGEGRPEGRHDEHWRRALEEVGAEGPSANDAEGPEAAASGTEPAGGTLGTPGGVASGLQPGGMIPGGGPGTGVGSLGTGGGATASGATGTPAHGTT
jgi:hypothetical protein